jgi:hypothetical protein
MGLTPESTCFISTPEVTKVMKQWLSHENGAPHPLSWNGIYEDHSLRGMYPLVHHRLAKRQAADGSVAPRYE